MGQPAVQAFSVCSRIKGDRVESPPCWFTKKCAGWEGGIFFFLSPYSSFSVTPTRLGAFSCLPSSNPRWYTLDHDALARQNTAALQAINGVDRKPSETQYSYRQTSKRIAR